MNIPSSRTERRALGDFSSFGILGTDNPIERFKSKLDFARRVAVYERKSNPKGELANAAYLAFQRSLPDLLIDVGFRSESVFVLDADTGKSAWLGPKFRTDLNRLFEQVGGREFGLVVAADVARLFRDASLQVPTQFAGLMQRNDTLLLTTHGGVWHLLDLRTPQDFETFIDWCRGAANHRRHLRGQMMAAKEQIVMDGAWSGRCIPVGWQVEPKSPSGTGKTEYNRLKEYAPHREVLFSWMRLSLQPAITSRHELAQAVREQGLSVPPFDPEIVNVAFQFPRSCLRVVTVHEYGASHRLRPDEVFYPTERFLLRALLQPLVFGDVLFGSGESGKAKLKKWQAFAEAQNQLCDLLVRDYFQYVGTFPELSLIHDEDDVELVDAVWLKWSTYDLKTARESQYTVLVPNACQTAGKPQGRRPRSTEPVNHWQGKVYCAKHGADPLGSPLLTHPLTFNTTERDWRCIKDRSTLLRNGQCSAWQCKNALGRVLDAHLLRGIRAALESDTGIVESLDVTSDPTATISALEQMLHGTSQQLERQIELAGAFQESLSSLPAEFRKSRLEQYMAQHVSPLAATAAKLEQDLARARQALKRAPAQQQTIERITDIVSTAVRDWGDLPGRAKMNVIGVFVKHVAVFIPDGFTARDCLVEFTWNSGWTDYLVAWRGASLDVREWQPDEDRQITEFWSREADVPWVEFKQRLQPNRKFSTVRRRARTLGVGKLGRRSEQWIAEAMATDRCFGDINPEVLYLQWRRLDGEDWCLPINQEGRELPIQALPPEMLRGLLQGVLANMLSRSRA